MPDAPRVAVSTLRRRVVGVGCVVAAVVALIGAPWFLDRIEADLEERVPAQLTAAGFDEVTATFSGQDGHLRCSSPLVDPDAARSAARAVTGVRSISVDRSCRVSSAPTVATTVPADTVAPERSTPLQDGPAFESLADLLETDPQFGIFAALADEAEVTEQLSGTPARTLFVPTDAAFEAWPPDALAELRARPDALRRVVLHHLVDGLQPAASFSDRLLRSFDGTMITLRVGSALEGDPPRPVSSASVDGVEIVTSDLTAIDGVAHAIDGVLVPDGVEIDALAPVPIIRARVADGTIELTGTVDSELRRTALVAAAGRVVHPDNVLDRLDLDDGDEFDTALLAPFVAAIEVVARAAGTATVEVVTPDRGRPNARDGPRVVVTATFVDDAARARLEGLADDGVTVELTERPVIASEGVEVIAAALAAEIAESPIVFAPASAELAGDPTALFERLAGVIRRYDGVVVTVAGFTDTAGSAAVNVELSEQRAATVAAELVARGVPDAQVDTVGYGGAFPILVDGVEDADASRRVEFEVRLGVPLGASGSGAADVADDPPTEPAE